MFSAKTGLGSHEAIEAVTGFLLNPTHA